MTSTIFDNKNNTDSTVIIMIKESLTRVNITKFDDGCIGITMYMSRYLSNGFLHDCSKAGVEVHSHLYDDSYRVMIIAKSPDQLERVINSNKFPISGFYDILPLQEFLRLQIGL